MCVQGEIDGSEHHQATLFRAGSSPSTRTALPTGQRTPATLPSPAEGFLLQGAGQVGREGVLALWRSLWAKAPPAGRIRAAFAGQPSRDPRPRESLALSQGPQRGGNPRVLLPCRTAKNPSREAPPQLHFRSLFRGACVAAGRPACFLAQHHHFAPFLFKESYHNLAFNGSFGDFLNTGQTTGVGGWGGWDERKNQGRVSEPSAFLRLPRASTPPWQHPWLMVLNGACNWCLNLFRSKFTRK